MFIVKKINKYYMLKAIKIRLYPTETYQRIY